MSQTVQCPQCKSSVAIAEQNAGKRVACPKCSKEFLAPGLVTSTSDDDDWLMLDDDPKPAQPVSSPSDQPETLTAADIVPAEVTPAEITPAEISPAKTPRPAITPKPAESAPPIASASDTTASDPAGPPLSSSDEAALSQYDDFTAGIEPLPKPKEPPGTSEDIFGALPDIPPLSAPISRPPVTSAPSAPAPAPAATPIEYESEYRVRCNVCGSMLYAKATQEGKTIKCSDCFSEVLVPPPPKKKTKPKVDMSNAAALPMEESKVTERSDPFMKSAKQLLDEAEQTEEDPKPIDYGAPSVKEWALNVFGIFMDPGVVLHWLILSTFCAIPAFLALAWGHGIVMILMFIGSVMLGALAVSCGFAILISVSNNEDRVGDWPTADPVAWIDQLVVAFAATGLAAAPAYAMGQFVFGHGLVAALLTMFSIYALLPFFLLSMMDMGSIFTPFSPEVARSVTRCQEAWGGFYFSSGLLFAGLYFFYILLSQLQNPPVAGVLGIFATVAIVFTYFAMMGRLAYAIGHAVNDPPRAEQFDRSQKA